MIPFDFLSQYHSQYTEGDCWVLARCLNEDYNLDIVVSPDIPFWYHAAVQTSAGLIVDIKGVHNIESFSEDWGFPIYWDNDENGNLESDMTFFGTEPDWDQASDIANLIFKRLDDLGVIL